MQNIGHPLIVNFFNNSLFISLLTRNQSATDKMLFFKTSSLYMDYDGQRRAETYFELIIASSSVVGFALGFYFQRFSFTVAALAVGLLLSALISIPPWPMYRRKPLRWQKHVPLEDNCKTSISSGGAGGDTNVSKPSTKKSGGKGGKKNN